jgi:hypothetical protein
MVLPSGFLDAGRILIMGLKLCQNSVNSKKINHSRFVQYSAYTLGYSVARPATLLHAMQYTYKNRKLSDIHLSLPALLPHFQDTLDSRLEAQLEPFPPPLTVQTLPFRAASLVEPLPAEVLAHRISVALDIHHPECPGNIHSSLVVHVDCSPQCRTQLHGCWLRHWRWTAAVASRVE